MMHTAHRNLAGASVAALAGFLARGAAPGDLTAARVPAKAGFRVCFFTTATTFTAK
ncbi:MAG TPA: hypothetical protein VFE47_11470 [Tepidisphaeraceae bacterium]|jgi:hypothetical protein|nr:hypothetical protein [Tepidisphaeraceae bacterium]